MRTEKSAAHTPESWLWPDRVIYKRESRALRDEHNAVVNLCATLVEALAMLDRIRWTDWPGDVGTFLRSVGAGPERMDEILLTNEARSALKAAGGGE